MAQRRKITFEQTVEATTGPLPDPAVLKAYDQVLPGAAHRIIAMAEDEQRHQHGMQNSVIRSDCLGTRLGQIFAFAIGMAGMVIGGILIYADKTVSGLSSFFVPLATLAGIYFFESRRKPEKPDQPPQSPKQK
jgi:uncharacterized membrane protein